MRLLVCLMVALAPFEGYLQLLHPQATKVVGGALVLTWGWGLLRGRVARVSGRVPLAALALTLVVLASLMLHAENARGVEIAIRYLSFLAVTIVLVDVFRSGAVAPASAARAYVAGVTVASVAATATYVLGDSGRATGPLEDPNDLAFFFVTAVPLAAGLRRRSSWPGVYDLAVLVLVGGAAATLSRGGAVALAVVFLIALLAGQIRPRTLVALGAAAVVALLAVPPLLGTTLSNSLLYKENVASSNVDERLIRWEAAARMTADAPLLGLGPAGFRTHYLDYVDRLPENPLEPLDVSHNMYLEISSELGLVGLVAFLALVGHGAAGGWRRWRFDRDPLALGVVAATAGASIAAVFITEQYYLPLWLLAAMGAALDPDPVEEAAGPEPEPVPVRLDPVGVPRVVRR